MLAYHIPIMAIKKYSTMHNFISLAETGFFRNNHLSTLLFPSTFNRSDARFHYTTAATWSDQNRCFSTRPDMNYILYYKLLYINFMYTYTNVVRLTSFVIEGYESLIWSSRSCWCCASFPHKHESRVYRNAASNPRLAHFRMITSMPASSLPHFYLHLANND